MLTPILERVDTTHHWIVRPGHPPEHVELPLPIEAHGKPYPRGACPIRRGESVTRLALFDLDDHDKTLGWPTMVEAAGRVYDECVRRGLRPVPFRSGGGHGVHLFVLWDDPQDAHSVRCALREVLTAVGYRPGTGGVQRGEVEIFPKQDHVGPDKAGSMFVLPLARQSVPLDPVLDFTPCDAPLWEVSAPVPVRERAPKDLAPANAPHADADELWTLLQHWDPACSYEDWYRILAIIHHESGGEDWGKELAIHWSEPGWDPTRSRYASCADEIEAKWDSFGDAERPLTAASLRVERVAEAGEFEPIADDESEVPPRARFAPIPAHEFAQGKPLDWIVRGVVPRAELMVIYGQSGSGKTFLTLDLVAAIARGVAWRDRAVRQGRVVYVVAEGIAGFRARLRAYAHGANVALTDVPLRVVPATPHLMDGDQALELARAIVEAGGADVIVIDTLAAAMAGANENSGEDMGTVLRHCRGLHVATGAVVILVHHSGKDETRGARGWSGLRAAADAELEVTRVGESRRVTVTKMKDGEDGATFGFKLVPVNIGIDADGADIMSCYVEPTEIVQRDATEKRSRLTNIERIVLDALQDLTPPVGGGAPPDEDVLIEEVLSRLPSGNGQRARIGAALVSLSASGRIQIRDGKVELQ